MGGCTLVLKGKTKEEVERELAAKLQEASGMGLYEDRRSEIIYDPQEELFRVVLKIHT